MLRFTCLLTLFMVAVLSVQSASAQFAATEAEDLATDVEGLDFNVLTGDGDLTDENDVVGYGSAASSGCNCCTPKCLCHRSCLQERGITFQGR